MRLYSIKDRVSREFNQPFLAKNAEMAERLFQKIVFDGVQVQQLDKNDYELYELGTFDNESGVIVSNIVFIQSGANIVFKTEVKKDEAV